MLGESFATLRSELKSVRSEITAFHPLAYATEEFREGGLNLLSMAIERCQ